MYLSLNIFFGTYKIENTILNTTITHKSLSASIKHAGAELFSLTDQKNEYIWNGNADFWPKHSPVLFPIVGSLKQDSYTVNQKKYQLPRHGFARDMDFKLIEKTESAATFSLEYDNHTLEKYPFKFELQILYHLEDNKLHITYKVINRGITQMPFSIGAHPAFSLPGNFTDFSLLFEKEEKLEYNLLDNGLISDSKGILKTNENVVPLNYKLFENDALVFKKLNSNSLTILQKSKPYIKVNFKDFPNLGIWTKENAPFLCIEPWFGYSDTLESTGNLFEKEAIMILEAGETFSCTFSIEIL